MLHWIKKGTRLIAGTVFFIILAIMLVTSRGWSTAGIVFSLGVASGAAILFWFAGFVVCDIILKGLVTHIDDRSVDTLVDGGMLQRLRMMQEDFVPGGAEIPFTQKIVQAGKGSRAGK